MQNLFLTILEEANLNSTNVPDENQWKDFICQMNKVLLNLNKDRFSINNIEKIKKLGKNYPDMLLLLSSDIIVLDLIFSEKFDDILLDVDDVGLNQPVEFLLELQLAALIRNKVESMKEDSLRLDFNYISSSGTIYEIRIFHNDNNIICLIRDVSDLVTTKNNLEYLVSHDTLTGLPNRSSYYRTLNETIKVCNKANLMFGILFFDLDRFKSINDSLGHRVGDELLTSIAQCLTQNLKENEFVARISGDEFIIIVQNVSDESEIIETAKRILSIFKMSFQLESHVIDVKASIGVSIYPMHSKDADILTQYADTAMYQAKDFGGNQIVLFNEIQKSKVERNFQIDQNLRKAISKNELFLVYQPQFSLSSGEITGFESLIRWKLNNNEMIAPSDFIYVAELTGYINELGLWIINKVCSQISHWKKIGIKFKKIAINLSRLQLIDSDLVSSIFSIMKFHGVEGADLVFEVTEDSILKKNNLALNNLLRLNEAGINIAIDDFGSGYSSFVDLKNIPFSELKIDKSIIDDIHKDENNDAIILAIITLGKKLGMKIVAEGVETKKQFEFLKRNDCNIIQGYYLGKPQSVSDIEEILRAN